jgi:hypothetical protein
MTWRLESTTIPTKSDSEQEMRAEVYESSLVCVPSFRIFDEKDRRVLAGARSSPETTKLGWTSKFVGNRRFRRRVMRLNGLGMAMIIHWFKGANERFARTDDL